MPLRERLIFDRIAFFLTNGFAMTSTERPTENLQDICRQIDDAKKEYDNLEMKKGEPLRDFEYRVKRHSDKLLSLKVAEKVQRQLLEQGAREAGEELKKKNI
jgi:hypothetical protein